MFLRLCRYSYLTKTYNGDMMKDKIVYFIIALIAFGVLSSCTAELVTEYRDSYSVLHGEQSKEDCCF